MTIVLNGTTGITNDGGYTGDGVVFADTTPANTLVTTTGGNVAIGTSSPGASKLNVQGTQSATLGTTAQFTLSTGQGFYLNSETGNINRIAVGTGEAMAFNIGSTEQARITSAGLFQFNSGYGSVATAYGCRAWVNFNGTGTVAIRASGNVSSITDNGVGDYTVNFATALVDANYCVGGSAKITSGSGGTGPANEPLTIGPYNLATGSFRIYTTYDSTVNDAQIACVDVHR